MLNSVVQTLFSSRVEAQIQKITDGDDRTPLLTRFIDRALDARVEDYTAVKPESTCPAISLSSETFV